MRDWDEEESPVPRGFVHTRSSTSAALQVCLQFNVYMSAIFLVLQSLALTEKLRTFELDVFGKVLAPLTFGVWCASEVFRLWFGFTGNLQEKLPQMSVFLLLSLFPQLPCLLYLMNLQDLQFPVERILGGFMFTFTGVELVMGYHAMQALVKKQTTSYSRLVSEDKY
ncbi:Transmembrane protein 17 [Hondaea fermentalgiana]|uniref:Transmembrane protein 17 n=1 Tax=Hondaea fermentalgiana TaxID=2315210 RepID=A0A2R5GIF6_9STRA|nr:Transmembrane protein 17 [Hondaea fermentalgiana]|eukprot:GBG28061.1 Transmembrane protein 17 [Hondaea fermentalgiana]